MRTRTLPELSKKNKYWVEKHRYYELKHFCLQYPIWKQAYAALDSLSRRPDDLLNFKTNVKSDPTAKCAESRIFYSQRISMIEKAAKETDESLAYYIIKGVTEELTYEHLKVNYNIPCCRNTYYELYRRFFWILNKIRN